MNFPFNINDTLKTRICKVKSDLMPEGFPEDGMNDNTAQSKREYPRQVQYHMTEIVDAMGHASAKAQGLQKAITTSDRLRSFPHTVYLLTNPEGNGGKGSVIGLLKTGRKKLFVFDAAGQHYEMEPLCVLDFYIHESMQRMGCGKLMYEHMLQEEKIKPEHLAIDKPSEKFLAFLKKHYSLIKIVPQANNYVVFEGFFINHPGLLSRVKTHSALDNYWETLPPESSSSKNGNLHYSVHRPSTSVGELLHFDTTGVQEKRESGHDKAADCPAISNVFFQPSVKTDMAAPVRRVPISCKQDLKYHHTKLW